MEKIGIYFMGSIFGVCLSACVLIPTGMNMLQEQKAKFYLEAVENRAAIFNPRTGEFIWIYQIKTKMHGGSFRKEKRDGVGI